VKSRQFGWGGGLGEKFRRGCSPLFALNSSQGPLHTPTALDPWHASIPCVEKLVQLVAGKVDQVQVMNERADVQVTSLDGQTHAAFFPRVGGVECMKHDSGRSKSRMHYPMSWVLKKLS